MTSSKQKKVGVFCQLDFNYYIEENILIERKINMQSRCHYMKREVSVKKARLSDDDFISYLNKMEKRFNSFLNVCKSAIRNCQKPYISHYQEEIICLEKGLKIVYNALSNPDLVKPANLK